MRATTALPLAALLVAGTLPGFARCAEISDGDWPMPAHDYAGTRFSPLD